MKVRKTIGHNEVFMLPRPGSWPKMLGSRVHLGKLPDDQKERKLGYSGRRSLTLTAPIELNKGVNRVVVKASPQRPLVVETTLEVLETYEEHSSI